MICVYLNITLDATLDLMFNALIVCPTFYPSNLKFCFAIILYSVHPYRDCHSVNASYNNSNLLSCYFDPKLELKVAVNPF